MGPPKVGDSETYTSPPLVLEEVAAPGEREGMPPSPCRLACEGVQLTVS